MTDTLKMASNSMDFSTFREIEKDGKTWLVVNGVPLVEGVLKEYLVPYEEFGLMPFAWDDVPLVIRHPNPNLNNGSARVPDPGVPVVGRFYESSSDPEGRRLTGQYWIEKDLLLAADYGDMLYENMKAGRMVEVSTGYYAPSTIMQNGVFKGNKYVGIHKGLIPDHIAILPDEIGACSISDGCGLNRNTSGIVQNCGDCTSCPAKMIANMTGNLPAGGKKVYERVYKECIAKGDDKETASKKAWGAVENAGWKKSEDGKWMMHNSADNKDFQNSAMIAIMIPEELRADLQAKYPFMDDATRDSLHITIIHIGDNRTVDRVAVTKALFQASSSITPIKGKMSGLARFVSDDNKDAIVATFDSPAFIKLYREVFNALSMQNIPFHQDHGFIPHMTIGYIDSDASMPVETIEPMEMNFSELSLVVGGDVLPVPFGGYTSYINSTEVPKAKQSASDLKGWLANANHFTKEFLMKVNAGKLKAFLNSLGFSNVAIEDKGDEGLSLKLEGTGDDSALDNIVQLNSVVQNVGGAGEFAKLIESLKGIPAALSGMQVQLNDGLAKVNAVAQHAQSVAEKEAETKKGLVTSLVANKANLLPEATLNALSVSDLERLEASYQNVDYSGVGASFFQNSNDGDNAPLARPTIFFHKEDK